MLIEIRKAAAGLDCSDISTLEDLRKCISKDVDKNILWLSEHAQINHSLLLALLIADFDDNAGLSGKRKLRRYWRGLQTFPSAFRYSRGEVVRQWRQQKSSVFRGGPPQLWSLAGQLLRRQYRLWSNWRRHWSDALVIVILPLLLVFLALRAQSINNRNVPYVTVQQGASAPAFQKLSDNLVLTNVPYAKGAFTSIADVRGRYTLVNVPGGSTLSSDHVLSSELSSQMADRMILSVPLKAGSYLSTMKTPSEAVMVISPRKEGERTQASFNVIVLRFDKTGDTTSAIVAIPKYYFDEASALLASHHVLIAQAPQGSHE